MHDRDFPELKRVPNIDELLFVYIERAKFGKYLVSGISLSFYLLSAVLIFCAICFCGFIHVQHFVQCVKK
jgi:hypothetical protein